MVLVYRRVFQNGRYMCATGYGFYEEWTHRHEVGNELANLLLDATRPLEEVTRDRASDQDSAEDSGEEGSDQYDSEDDESSDEEDDSKEESGGEGH